MVVITIAAVLTVVRYDGIGTRIFEYRGVSSGFVRLSVLVSRFETRICSYRRVFPGQIEVPESYSEVPTRILSGFSAAAGQF